MKLFDHPCRRHRQDLALLASGALPPGEQDSVAQHLSACPACREYLAQINAVILPLATWAERLPQVEPSLAAQQRWAGAIQAADQSTPVHGSRLARHQPPLSQVLWQKLILPSRHAWAGLAAVWLLLVGVNVALRNDSPAPGGKPVTASAMIDYGDQQKLLNELFADRSLPVEADRPRVFSPKPRTEKNESIAV